MAAKDGCICVLSTGVTEPQKGCGPKNWKSFKLLFFNGGLFRVFNDNVHSLRRGYITQCFSNLTEQRTYFKFQSLWQD